MSFVGEPDPILGSSPRTSVAEDNDNNKTVDPSQKRLAWTREHGDVVKSHEVSDSLMLAGAWPAQVAPTDRRITGEIERLLPQQYQ